MGKRYPIEPPEAADQKSLDVKKKKKPARATKALSPAQVEARSWIENAIVPSLVEKFIKEKLLHQEKSRG